jgi:hypothetical protein
MSYRVGIPDEARLRGSQIKSRERVRALAEVYTHEREVNAMLDLIPDMFPSEADPGNTDRTFLEPACGSGNFLVEILRRKLHYVTPRRYGRGERFEHRILRCLASIYGIDITADNIQESRDRMRAMIAAHFAAHADPREASPGLHAAVEAIVKTNLVHADTLADVAEIELVEYRPGRAGTFVREWFHPLDPAVSEPNLFLLALRRDEVPIHYSELARKTKPVRVDSFDWEAA